MNTRQIETLKKVVEKGADGYLNARMPDGRNPLNVLVLIELQRAKLVDRPEPRGDIWVGTLDGVRALEALGMKIESLSVGANTAETNNATEEKTMTTETKSKMKLLPGNAVPPIKNLTAEAARKIAEDLNGLTMGPLKQRYLELLGLKATSSNRVYLMRKIIAAIDSKTEKQQKPAKPRAVKATSAKAPKQPRAPKDRDPRLPKVGEFVEREFDGKTHKVKVLDDGFEYHGKKHRSLSAIAKEISGTTWNGFLFFHLAAYPEHKARAEKKAA